MSTRAVYTFKDEDDTFSVYKHFDGYPSGAAEFIERAKSKAWVLPRYEASDFAAAFITANKQGAGDVRMSEGPDAHGDLSFCYEIKQKNDGDADLYVIARDGSNSRTLFGGTLGEFIDWAKTYGD